ncbi:MULTISPECIES: hypothetical protein [Clostridiaceae]|uniref:TDE2712 family protein n=1 Tax=Clostridiaceae TaxID=31979 RepID=UPI00054EA2A9|nr:MULTISPECIES: hypothetical protein [Clostridiaceae]
MLKTIKVNLDEVESMLYFWQATSEKERVSEQYMVDVAAMKGISASYDEEFDAESVRKVLSSITNKELLSKKTKKEGRFWNYNMWVMEDLEYTLSMVQPVKQLNLDSLVEKLKDVDSKYEEVEVRFSPLSLEDYIIKDNSLIINFFKVKPSDFDDNTFIDGVEIKEYICEKLKEVIAK